jgi:hypothetical protein
MDLSSPCIDAGYQDGVALGCGEVLRVVKGGEGELREGFAGYGLVALESAETVCAEDVSILGRTRRRLDTYAFDFLLDPIPSIQKDMW